MIHKTHNCTKAVFHAEKLYQYCTCGGLRAILCRAHSQLLIQISCTMNDQIQSGLE